MQKLNIKLETKLINFDKKENSKDKRIEGMTETSPIAICNKMHEVLKRLKKNLKKQQKIIYHKNNN